MTEYKCSCGGTFKFSHEDDCHTQWFNCDKCGHQESETKLSSMASMPQFEELDLPSQETTEAEMTLEDLERILSTTIKGDFNLKMILFLCTLLTFTKEDQVNLIITGESSIGKTYNINEVLWYFPEDITNAQAGATPKSFIHKKSARLVDVRDMKFIDPSDRPKKGDPKEKWDVYYEKLRNSGYFLDYSKKIFVFPDMPN